ncbi:ATP-dependent DNA helicase RecQ-like [Montipora foliosa]|uniref:ATP-dependent DNA helicase RecQ-like n=1 Tax=Montipora foliosa TaxID=591990 RepID=UPI0035F1A0D2
MAAVSDADFNRAVKFSLAKRGTPNIYLKPKQLEALKAIVQQKRDVLAILPTGYGKSVTYQLVPNMCNFLFQGGNYCSIAIIVSPLTALMMDQVEKIKMQGQSTAIIQAECLEAVNFNDREINVHGDSVENVLRGRVSILLMLQGNFVIGCVSKNVVCVVADEAHCIMDWGYDFRPDYGKLDTIASIFPSKPFIALTATAPVAYQDAIIEKFAMQNPLRVLENPNRSNIFYDIRQRPPAIKKSNEEQFEKLINGFGCQLKELKNNFPLTIIYTSLHLSNLVMTNIFLLSASMFPLTDCLHNFQNHHLWHLTSATFYLEFLLFHKGCQPCLQASFHP